MAWMVVQASNVYGTVNVIKFYGIPWLFVTHWFIMITYVSPSVIFGNVISLFHQLHHTSPEIPPYRATEWNFQRGAAATVDRDFLGWQGRFFLHDGRKDNVQSLNR